MAAPTDLHRVRRATDEDLPRLADVLAVAFEGDPVTRSHFPEGADRVGTMRRFFAFVLENEFLPYGLVFTTEDLVAVAAWLPPQRGGSPPEDGAGFPDELRDIFGGSSRMVEEILGIQAEHHPTEPHYYLQFMGTLPEWQGRGIGSSLMAPVLEMCDRERLPAYLDASSDRSRDFYRRHGFRVVAELPLSTGAMFWHMIRRAG